MPDTRTRRKDLVEVFGYGPDDLTPAARSLWNIGGCPFTNKPCSKTNHDASVTYGTCSVTTPYGDCIICPNRLYENEHASLKRVAQDAFGADVPMLMFDEYIRRRNEAGPFVVALGHGSGREVQVARSLSMDWVLAKIESNQLIEYAGLEVQSIDITGNYRDCWYGYKNLTRGQDRESIPASRHGLKIGRAHV